MHYSHRSTYTKRHLAGWGSARTLRHPGGFAGASRGQAAKQQLLCGERADRPGTQATRGWQARSAAHRGSRKFGR
jgi:hypothetical protein